MRATLDPYLAASDIWDPDWDLNSSRLLTEKYSPDLTSTETIRVETRHGKECLLLSGFVGSEKKAQLFEFFTMAKDHSGADEGLGFLLDFFDGVLEFYFKHGREARLPLDFTSRKFENIELWARQEFRNFEAESLAEALLDADTIKNHSKIE